MYCSKCGKDISGNSSVCLFCGTQVNDVTSTSAPIRDQQGPLRHVRIVAVLMIIQGSLVSILGLLMLPAGISNAVRLSDQGKSSDVAGILITSIVLALLFLISGGLLILAGIKNRRYRARKLGIFALSLGTFSILGIFCAPTAIGLLIYGLIVYLNSDVARIFELTNNRI